MKFYLKTYGCQMNVHDSEKIAGIFSESGYGMTESVKDADVIVLNTCSVRQKAEQKVYSDIGRLKPLKQKNPALKIAVAGCIAQQKGNALFKRFPYVDFIFGPQNIDSLQRWINGQLSAVSGQSLGSEIRNPKSEIQITALRENPEYSLKTLPLKREGRVKAWVSIMHGCDNFCSYCVVPFTRGRERSRTSRDICNEVQDIAGQGFKEITLLGQNVNSYGKNLNEKNPPSPPFDKGGQGGFLNQKIDFPDLLKVIHEVPGIERIRFVTSHPRDLSEKLIDCMRNLPKICEHIHLPIQAGSDRILNLMNRRYTYQQYKEKIDMLRTAIPNIAITTDIIAGFPGETDEDFNYTINALKEIEFDGIFAFKYSERPDTKALNLPEHVDEDIKAQRLSQVLELQASITYNKNKALEGKAVEILVEGVSETDKHRLTGRTMTNKIVNFHVDTENKSSNSSNSLIGRLIYVKILEAKQHSLYGEKI